PMKAGLRGWRRWVVEGVSRTSPPRPPVPAVQPKKVLACLPRAGLIHASATPAAVWSGYDRTSGTFTYVYLYKTKTAASVNAHRLAAEEVALAGLYVVHQAIARYAGSPVPRVAACLSGRPVKREHSGPKKKGRFTF